MKAGIIHLDYVEIMGVALREIIEKEPKPYSDSDLVDLLHDRGFIVARRTVAKYRSIEGILPAHLRKVSAKGR